MKVIKSLNNNMVLAQDVQGNECICQGKGIGWQKRNGDLVDESLIERRFTPENADDSRHFQQLFSEISEDFWKIAEEVVSFGQQRYNIKVSRRIILPLCDHMAGSVERYRQGMVLENPMLWDVKRVYPKEFKVGLYALRLLEKQYGVQMRDDEAAFLAYHFVNAELGNMESVSLDTMARMIGQVIDLVEQSFQIKLNEEDWNYQRFLTHLKFFMRRITSREACGETVEDELYQELKVKYPHVNRCVERIADMILIDFHYDISQEERLYLLIHLERVTRQLRRTKG